MDGQSRSTSLPARTQPCSVSHATEYVDLPPDRLVALAEATLGWKIRNPDRFLTNCADHCLGDALNFEHDYLDELLPSQL